ncbi:MAG: AsmA family protein [Burkholderiaceae bacterium]
MVLGVVLLGLVLGVAWGESQGWPFLVEPLQRRLSSALKREVSFGSAPGDRTGARIGLLRGLSLSAPRLRIAAPEWSREPHMLLATDARVRLGYGDLWRAYRGGALHIRSTRAEQLDIVLERLADGRASWQTDSDLQAPRRPPPTFGQLEVPDGALRYRDVILDASVDAHFTLVDRSGRPASLPAESGSGGASTAARALAPAASARTASAASAATGASGAPRSTTAPGEPHGLRVVANGRYRGFPLKAHLETSGILPFAAEDTRSLAVPVMLEATLGRAKVEFHGTATDALHFGGMTGVFSVAGPSLAAVGDPLGVTLPSTPAFRTEGRIAKRDQVWNAVFDVAHIGSSRLTGAFAFDQGRAKPLLSGRLGGSRLLLADLGPAIGTSGPTAETPKRRVKANDRVLPSREFDLPSLQVMDANVLIDIAEVDLGTKYLEPLRPLRAHLRLEDAVLRLTDVDARTAQGRLAGTVQLDGRTKRAIWSTALRINDVRLERWVRQVRDDGSPPYVSGRLRGVFDLQGEGRSTAQILATLKGNVGLQLRDAKISHLAVEAAGIDIAQGVGLIVAGDKSLDVLCGVADLQAQAGVLRPRVLVIDTTDSTLSVSGAVSLVDESMDLRAVVLPKDFSPMALRTPLHVRGPLDDPKVSLEKGPLAMKLGASALLALVNPIAALLPLIDTGDKSAADQALGPGCRALAQRSGATTSGSAQASKLPAVRPRPRRP